MTFTESEQRFLRQEHQAQGLRAMYDLRQIGCPERIYVRILEQRATKLGNAFVRQQPQPTPITDNLVNEIQGLKLF